MKSDFSAGDIVSVRLGDRLITGELMAVYKDYAVLQMDRMWVVIHPKTDDVRKVQNAN